MSAFSAVANAHHSAYGISACAAAGPRRPLTDREDAALFADVLGEDDHAVEHAIDMDAVQVHLDELPEREQRDDAAPDGRERSPNLVPSPFGV
jgi:hypothetical protein